MANFLVDGMVVSGDPKRLTTLGSDVQAAVLRRTEFTSEDIPYLLLLDNVTAGSGSTVLRAQQLVLDVRRVAGQTVGGFNISFPALPGDLPD